MRTRWRTLFRADGLGELTEADLSVLRALGIRTVIDLRSEQELERGRFDVDAHPVAFHHFPFMEELPDAEEFDRRPGFLGSQYREFLSDAGGQIRAALEVLAAPDALPGGVPLHSRQGPHRGLVGHRALAARAWTSRRWWPTTR